MNLQRCGTLAALFLVLICISQTVEAGKKKKRVIVKVPARVKHIYHHHTKNLHIHKPKPKPEKYKSFDSPPRNRPPPPPFHGGKKKNQPWREENSYDDDYGFDEYDYGNYGYGGYEDKGRYKDNNRGRYKDDNRGYDYEPPKRGRWRGEEVRGKGGYSSQSKRSPQWKNSRKSAPKKPYRDMFEGAGTSLWPEVKEHDSWHQPRPQGFQQNTRIIPQDQYHDTSIHAIDYTEKQPTEFYPSVVSLERPSTYERPPSFDRPVNPKQLSSYYVDGPVSEALHHPLPLDYHQAEQSAFVPVTAEASDISQPSGLYQVQQNFQHSESFREPHYDPHQLQ